MTIQQLIAWKNWNLQSAMMEEGKVSPDAEKMKMYARRAARLEFQIAKKFLDLDRPKDSSVSAQSGIEILKHYLPDTN
jgi:hypothetical protein